MKPRFWTCMAAIAICTALINPSSAGAQQERGPSKQLPHYKLTILPNLGGTFGEAWGVNNGGSVIGHSTLAGDQVYHAFFWRKGVITDLGTLGGPNSNQGFLNDQGAVSGFSDTSTPDPNGEDFCGFGTNLICLPFVWQKGVMTALPLLGGNNGSAGGINNRSQIVGVSETPNSDPCSVFPFQIAATIWQDGNVQELPLLSGDQDGFANGINDKGHAVGQTGGCDNGSVFIHAVLWRDGMPIDLGNLGGITNNFAFGINNRDQVVGQSDLSGDTIHQPFLWQDGVMIDLGNLPGLPNGQAVGINNQGQVVGFSQDANGDDSTSVAWIWHNAVMTDLNTLIPADSPLFLMEALSINDRGQIAGFGRLLNGEHRGFLMLPCDEHQRGIEGCDYSMVDVPDAVRVSPVPRTQHPAASTPGRVRMGMLNRFRFSRRQNPVSGAGPATDQKQEAPANTRTYDLLGDHRLSPPCWPPFRCQHRGVCDVDSAGRLTGYCSARIPPFNFCDLKFANQCPKGKKALKPTLVQCGQGPPSRVDEDRLCTF
jgi:probable HAF family extracellular repeat protein